MSTSQCPNCGTVFAHGDEPWLKKREHCARHDVVYVAGSECTSCVAEREDESNRPKDDANVEVPVRGSSIDNVASVGKKGKRGNTN